MFEKKIQIFLKHYLLHPKILKYHRIFTLLNENDRI